MDTLLAYWMIVIATAKAIAILPPTLTKSAKYAVDVQSRVNVAAGTKKANVLWRPKMINREELKPCPFCGGEKWSFINHAMTQEQIICKKCGARGPISKDRIKAIAAWNNRVSQDVNIVSSPKTL